MSGRVAGTFAGTVALLLVAFTPATSGARSSGGAALPDSTTPTAPAPAPMSARTARPVLTVFTATVSSLAAGAPVVQFQVTDRFARVRVRLAFVSLAGDGTYRKNLRSRRTGVVHSYTWTPPRGASGDFRVRITARDRRGRRVVRATTVTVTPPAISTDHRFPVAGPYTLGGADARFGAKRTGHVHQGQDISAASGTPIVAPHSGQVTWVAYQASGAGYYVVMASDGEPYNYVFMHLLKGSTAVRQGDRVATGQQIGAVGATGDAQGPHLHFEVWDGPWFNGGHAIDPLPLLKQWPGA